MAYLLKDRGGGKGLYAPSPLAWLPTGFFLVANVRLWDFCQWHILSQHGIKYIGTRIPRLMYYPSLQLTELKWAVPEAAINVTHCGSIWLGDLDGRKVTAWVACSHKSLQRRLQSFGVNPFPFCCISAQDHPGLYEPCVPCSLTRLAGKSEWPGGEVACLVEGDTDRLRLDVEDSFTVVKTLH